MNRKLFFFIAAIIVCALAYGAFLYFKKAPRITVGAAEFVKTPDELLTFFENHEDSANKLFLNKTIEVRGEVQSVQQDSLGTAIFLKSSNPVSAINCHFDASINNKLRRIKVGDSVSVKGECTGYLYDVILTRCNLVEP
jgi:hypothetical protein